MAVERSDLHKILCTPLRLSVSTTLEYKHSKTCQCTCRTFQTLGDGNDERPVVCQSKTPGKGSAPRPTCAIRDARLSGASLNTLLVLSRPAEVNFSGMASKAVKLLFAWRLLWLGRSSFRNRQLLPGSDRHKCPPPWFQQ